jgi:hypothetical protein
MGREHLCVRYLPIGQTYSKEADGKGSSQPVLSAFFSRNLVHKAQLPNESKFSYRWRGRAWLAMNVFS